MNSKLNEYNGSYKLNIGYCVRILKEVKDEDAQKKINRKLFALLRELREEHEYLEGEFQDHLRETAF